MRRVPIHRRWLVLAAIVVAAAAAGGAYAAFPDTNVDTYTGCLNTSGAAGGQLGQIATGLSPLKACGSNQKLVHLSGGDITKVTAGSGLTGGGDNGAVMLSVGGGYQLPQTCSDGESPQESGGSWACATYAGADQSCASGKFADGIGSTGSLTCGAPAPSHAYTTTNTLSTEPGSTREIVGLSDLPDGSYIVWATLSNKSGDDVHCVIGLPGTGSFITDMDFGTIKDHSVSTITGMVSLSGNQKVVDAQCYGDDSNPDSIESAFTALQVGAVN